MEEKSCWKGCGKIGFTSTWLCLPWLIASAAADPPQCPPDTTLVGQVPYDETGPWQVFVSNALFPGFDPLSGGIRLLEHFKGAGGPVQGLGWWGVSAVIDDHGQVIECPLEPGEFLIEFYAHDPVSGFPDFAAGPLFSEMVDAASGLLKADTGHVYATEQGGLALWYWQAELASVFSAFEGWISIQNADSCQFWWAASPGPAIGGDGLHLEEDQSVSPPERSLVAAELSFCLTTEAAGPWTGACCARDSAICRDTPADQCAGVFDVFHADLTCSQISCTAEAWACCSAGVCSMETLSDCIWAGGDWYRFYVCSTTDPAYDPDAFGPGQHNRKSCPPIEPLCPITCETPAAFGRGLSGGYHYISWDRPGDQRYVIDRYVGFSGAINRIKWWGLSCIIWDGPDCEFAEPAPFVIKFYNSTGSPAGPDWQNPVRIYDPVYAETGDPGYSWTKLPECGRINCYTVTLPTTYSPGTGTKWISIASKTEDCDFVWLPGPDGAGGQWFYDNGVCEPEPGSRHRSFCLNTNIHTGACCYEASGVCQEWQEQPACVEAGSTFYRSKTCAQIPEPGCFAHLGACCDRVAGECSITLGADCSGAGRVWLGSESVCDQCCVYTPPECQPEGEPDCFDGYVDVYDPGCDGATPVFLALEGGDIVCGAFGTFHENPDGSGAELRDSDWYQIEVVGVAVIRLNVRCENARPLGAVPGGPSGSAVRNRAVVGRRGGGVLRRPECLGGRGGRNVLRGDCAGRFLRRGVRDAVYGLAGGAAGRGVRNRQRP